MIPDNLEDDTKDGNNVAVVSDSNWESNTYPTASAELHAWMREQRGLIRVFLASNLGTVGASTNRNAANAGRARTKRSVVA